MKYLIGVGVFFIVLIIAITLIFARRPSNPNQDQPTRPLTAVDYLNDSSRMVLTTQGSVVGDDTRRSIRITVTSSSRLIEQINGYQGVVVASQSYPNNSEAYRYFLASLDTARFTRERRTNSPDPVGACPLGETYLYQIQSAGTTPMDRWSSTCGSQGNFGGNSGLVQTLFQKQITDYSDFTRSIVL